MKANLKFWSVAQTGHTPEYWKQHAKEPTKILLPLRDVVMVDRCAMNKNVLRDAIWQGIKFMEEEVLDEQCVCHPSRASFLIPRCYEAYYYHYYLLTGNREEARKMAREHAQRLFREWQAIQQHQGEQQPDEQPNEQPG